MGVLVKADWVGHFMALLEQLRNRRCLRPPNHSKEGVYLYVGSNLAQFGGM
jgi:hypothetical protein